MNRSRGFTLLEVILTIILAALAGLASYTFLGGVLTRSAEPVFMVQDLAGIRAAMEGVAASYQEYLQGGITWPEFQASLAGLQVSDATSELGSPGFQILRVTISANDGGQSISSLFSQ